MSTKPNVLIFGGMNGLAPLLALHLVPLDGEPLVSHLRMADKYAMSPPTTYVTKEFLILLKDRNELAEYRQTNLTVQDRVRKCFTDPSPNGEPYTHIIDLTGEIEFDRSPEIYVSHTLNVALAIALEASKQSSVKSYIRHMPPSYDHIENKTHKEEDVEGWKPWGTRGIWWHETIRAVGSIPDLPLVLVRGAQPYGPGVVRGPIASALCISLIYKQRDDANMRFLWSPQLKRTTIHSLDWAPAIWETSLWAADKPRPTLNELAGVGLLPTGDDMVEVTECTVKEAKGEVVVPTFNLADEGDLDQEGLARTLSRVFGIRTGFQGSIMSRIAGLKLDTVFEDVNDRHLGEWAHITTTASPRILSTPLFPILYMHELKKSGCGLDGTKFRELIGYKFKYPEFNEETVRQTIESWRTEGIWPNVNLSPPSSR